MKSHLLPVKWYALHSPSDTHGPWLSKQQALMKVRKMKEDASNFAARNDTRNDTLQIGDVLSISRWSVESSGWCLPSTHGIYTHD